MPSQSDPNTSAPRRAVRPTAPDTIISVVFAFAVAFLFRAFVIEPFVIPTGSMAPTLLGAHFRAISPISGADWAIDRRLADRDRGSTIRDPYTADELDAAGLKLRSGDRILVLKRTPLTPAIRRYEVAVFRNPTNPSENLIKRIIGLPGEQIALVDGDVFVRPSEGHAAGDLHAWESDEWRIARKPERQQRAVWQPVFDAAHTPIEDDPEAWPWLTNGRWTRSGTTLVKPEAGPAALEWDDSRWEIRDRLAYDDIDIRRPARVGSGGSRAGMPPNYPVSDLSISFGFEPTDEQSSVSIELSARQRVFRAVIEGSTARLQWRAEDDAGWTTLAEEPMPKPMPAGRATMVEFWHADQALWLFVDDRLVAHAPYDWSIRERVEHSIAGSTLEQLEPLPRGMSMFSPSEQYIRPGVRILVPGAPASIHRLRVERDLYYHPHQFGYRRNADLPPMGTHPLSTVTLNRGQYFALGDNSAASKDGRTWGPPDPRVARAFPKTAAPGIVPEQLMLGRAFLVYFPSIDRDGPIPVPDLGRIRAIH